MATDTSVNAKVKLVVPVYVVSGISFPVTMQIDSAGYTYGSYDFILSDLGHAQLNSVSLSDPFKTLSTAGPTDNAHSYEISAIQNPNPSKSSEYKNLFSVNTMLSGDKVTDTFTIKDTPRSLGAASSGIAFQVVADDGSTSIPGVSVQSHLSTCGDGYLGYQDLNGNGIQDTNEPNEVCDDGPSKNSNSPDEDGKGCFQCQYIKIGYKSTGNCGLMSQNCHTTAANPQEIFIGKLNALTHGTCYPTDPAYPTPLYCDVTTHTPVLQYDSNTGKLSGTTSDINHQKTFLVVQVTAALIEYFQKLIAVAT